MTRVGFVINPIAGMGGRVGLKGTDGVAEKAARRGAQPVAPGRAVEMLRVLAPRPQASQVRWLTCGEPMGAGALAAVGMPHEVVYRPASRTTAEDTRKACAEFLSRGVDLIVFVGGDGTARDVASVVGHEVPIVGVPSGVKMHSAVFGIRAESIASILADFVDGRAATVDAEVLDLDEDAYRRGEWVVRLQGTAKTIHEPTLIQSGKLMVEVVSDEEARDAIATHVIEEMDGAPDTVFLLGPGGTIQRVKERLGIEGTLLGIDALKGKKLVAADLDEEGILRLLNRHEVAKLVLSPIGSQGFLLGRGNLPLSPAVLRRVGLGNIVVVATPDKLRHTPVLLVDTGDRDLDRAFAEKEYLFVVKGYHEMRVHPIRA